MKIGELAKRSGIAASAIRYYEQSGLLPSAERGANGYRVYGAAALERLQIIQIAQNLGFTLDAVRTILAKQGSDFQDGLMDNLDIRLAEIEKMMATLSEQRVYLLNLKQRLRASWAEGVCLNGIERPQDLSHDLSHELSQERSQELPHAAQS